MHLKRQDLKWFKERKLLTHVKIRYSQVKDLFDRLDSFSSLFIQVWLIDIKSFEQYFVFIFIYIYLIKIPVKKK